MDSSTKQLIQLLKSSPEIADPLLQCLTFWKAIDRNRSCLFPNVPTNETSFIKLASKVPKKPDFLRNQASNGAARQIWTADLILTNNPLFISSNICQCYNVLFRPKRLIFGTLLFPDHTVFSRLFPRCSHGNSQIVPKVVCLRISDDRLFIFRKPPHDLLIISIINRNAVRIVPISLCVLSNQV